MSVIVVSGNAGNYAPDCLASIRERRESCVDEVICIG